MIDSKKTTDFNIGFDIETKKTTFAFTKDDGSLLKIQVKLTKEDFKRIRDYVDKVITRFDELNDSR